MRALALLLAAAAPLTGCINTDAAVFVAPTMDTPVVTVTSNALGVSVSGAFDLDLHLGARASGPSRVSLGEFDILDAQQKATIVAALALDAGATELPVTVQPDSDVDVKLTFDTGVDLLKADLQPQLCAAAGLVVSGRIQDSLEDAATPVTSAVFHASCQ